MDLTHGVHIKMEVIKNSYKFEDGKRVAILQKIICATCDKEFQPIESTRIYCGRDCYYQMKRLRKDRVIWTDEMRERLSKRYTGSGNPSFGTKAWSNGKKRPEITAEKHPLWRGGKYIINGYYHLSNEGNEIAEHRFVMEQHLGRKLESTEIVHHINYDKLDNRIENLQIVSRSEHPKIHKLN